MRQKEDLYLLTWDKERTEIRVREEGEGVVIKELLDPLPEGSEITLNEKELIIRSEEGEELEVFAPIGEQELEKRKSLLKKETRKKNEILKTKDPKVEKKTEELKKKISKIEEQVDSLEKSLFELRETESLLESFSETFQRDLKETKELTGKIDVKCKEDELLCHWEEEYIELLRENRLSANLEERGVDDVIEKIKEVEKERDENFITTKDLYGKDYLLNLYDDIKSAEEVIDFLIEEINETFKNYKEIR